ncbi:hypothetical protein PROFUN_15701 [Planoprotostelium fungivorum]|uniref:Uncharacterized protein n=1 Tax=Planoprotostelium fungivorum TaxID=1890364 RepID=A0A2P6MUN3_9EUKA|nr:hypothetical protein PROFUN_15701 [Planoprotostelium fungivorum]
MTKPLLPWLEFRGDKVRLECTSYRDVHTFWHVVNNSSTDTTRQTILALAIYYGHTPGHDG